MAPGTRELSSEQVQFWLMDGYLQTKIHMIYMANSFQVQEKKRSNS